MKQSALIVDHVFHKKTKSFQFLYDIIEERFDLQFLYVDPDGVIDRRELSTECEHVIICQLDFLTPMFLSQGKKVTVVQMFDGSAGLPNEHWQLNRQARYLNFSLAQHTRALTNGAESLLVKYFPDPEHRAHIDDFGTKRVFFWERLPHSWVNRSRITRLLSGQFDSLHIHAAHDVEQYAVEHDEKGSDKITSSTWFDSNKDYMDVLERHNIFIAPRIAEGIGHSFLEAMAMGMVVIAYDLETHNEYIENWVNGILYDQSVEMIDLSNWQAVGEVLGRNARASMKVGHQRWIKQRQGIIDFIENAPKSCFPSMPRIEADLADIVSAYQRGQVAYISALHRRALTVKMCSDWAEFTRPDKPYAGRKQFSRGLLDLVMGQANAITFLGRGWSHADAAHTWAVAREATLTIPNKSLPEDVFSMNIDVDLSARRAKVVTIAVNSVVAGSVVATPDTTIHRLHVTRDASVSLAIIFKVDDLDEVEGDSRRFAFQLKSLRVSVSKA